MYADFDAVIYSGNDILGLQKDADAGDAKAQYLFAMHLLKEPNDNAYRKDLSDEEVQRGLRYLQQAAAQGYLQGIAAEGLGSVYLRGEIVPVDYEKAKMWYNTALLKGIPIAAYQLAKCAYHGYGEDVNYEKAAKLYLDAAPRYLNALCCLGDMYLKGEYLPYDPVFAKILYDYALENENELYRECAVHSDIYDDICEWLDAYNRKQPPIPTEEIAETEGQTEVRNRLIKIMDNKKNKSGTGLQPTGQSDE